ncbi:hypothetical protein DV735_g1176, partial [Chaetothyriales sp. CBS 134920]
MTSKKPLFKRPAWAASGTKTTPATTSAAKDEIFGRHHLYEDIIALERKEKEEKEEKERRAKEKAAAAAAAERDALNQRPPAKKRRVSNDAEDEGTQKTRKSRSILGSDEAEQYHSRSPSSRSPSRKEKPGAELINLEDDDDVSQDVVRTTAKPESPRKTSKATSPGKITGGKGTEPEEDDEDEDDAYLRELKAKARERLRLEKLGLVEADDNSNSMTKAREASASAQSRPSTGISTRPGTGLSTVTPSTSPIVEEKHVDTNTAKSLPTPSTPPPPAEPAPDDPEVSIYINPLIPNTKALIVGRKASESLGPVKTFWCKKHGLSDAEAAKVFFIWRDMKLYNSSTMQHIVARLQKELKPNQKDSEGRIVLEAVTQEIYELRKAELAAKKERRPDSPFSPSFSPSFTGNENREGGGEDGKPRQQGTALSEPNPPAAVGNKFIIRLISKEYGELPIRIRPESTVGKIAAGFVQQMVAPRDGAAATNKVAYLIFDGDRLENDQTADEVGLEEGDAVEVQRQGWQQGQALGSRPANAPSDLDAQRLAAAKVGVVVKDDTLGLGAQLRSKDVAHQKTGLDAFQGLLGRLNAKDEAELAAVERREDDRKLEMYAKGRWGGGVVFAASVKKQLVPLKNGRHLLRGRNIEAKRKAFSDAKGLDAIFMRTTTATAS